MSIKFFKKPEKADPLMERVLMLEDILIEKAVITESDRSDLERGRPPITEEPVEPPIKEEPIGGRK